MAHSPDRWLRDAACGARLATAGIGLAGWRAVDGQCFAKRTVAPPLLAEVRRPPVT